jgi:hypothetical protein
MRLCQQVLEHAMNTGRIWGAASAGRRWLRVAGQAVLQQALNVLCAVWPRGHRARRMLACHLPLSRAGGVGLVQLFQQLRLQAILVPAYPMLAVVLCIAIICPALLLLREQEHGGEQLLMVCLRHLESACEWHGDDAGTSSVNDGGREAGEGGGRYARDKHDAF